MLVVTEASLAALWVAGAGGVDSGACDPGGAGAIGAAVHGGDSDHAGSGGDFVCGWDAGGAVGADVQPVCGSGVYPECGGS